MPESATGQLMEVMCLAMSIDYSLFFLRRFRDEVARGEGSVDTGICNALRHAGHVILLSGTTIVVVFLGFLLLPSDVLRMDGTCTYCRRLLNIWWKLNIVDRHF